ncbi:FAD binding domain-containing protein [Rutstroemia sp. NJR-2017a WRK4]|nr:FAD binding domain-containing protein [Rutstroemia sp. NJR-2017a WRK4]
MSRPQVIRMPTTSHCIPEEPVLPSSAAPSLSYSSSSSSDPEPEEILPRRRRASTKLISQNATDMQRIIGEAGTKLVEKCCGGGCCMAVTKSDSLTYEKVKLPENDAFASLGLKIETIPTTLSSVPDVPKKTIELSPLKATQKVNEAARGLEGLKIGSTEKVSVDAQSTNKTPSPADSGIALDQDTNDSIDFTPHHAKEEIDTRIQPPIFVQPHPPYEVYSAKIFSARELTKPGAEKRTYHFDLDVTDYPEEGGVDFKVGGAIGVMAPNEESIVDELMDLLSIPRHLRDRKVLLKTESGRWPTVWGDDKPRELVTTRRDLLTWCSDIQSYPPTKNLLRLFAEYASDENEKKILLYLCSAEGQGVFCDFRTGPHITINQLLHAFPSSKPPLDHLLSQLQTLMPRFYSMSNDPHESCVPVEGCSRLIEIAVTVHETNNWRGGPRTGLGSGFFERQARKFIEAEKEGRKVNLRIPMFKGLMANPLAREFVSDGPMLLIGAGVGVAPFRGFVQRRLKNANCANKVWVLQGVRDSLLDELYSGEWGVHESEVKKVVQSRKPGAKQKGKYVQDEVRHQADLVWFIINALDGRVFVCGSSKGMGEGVEEALVDVAMEKGNLGREEAKKFWKLKNEAGQYIAETW